MNVPYRLQHTASPLMLVDAVWNSQREAPKRESSLVHVNMLGFT